MASLLDSDPDETPYGDRIPQTLTPTQPPQIPLQAPLQHQASSNPRQARPSPATAASYLSYPVKYAVNSAFRRLNSDSFNLSNPNTNRSAASNTSSQPPSTASSFTNLPSLAASSQPSPSYTPPPRALSPLFQPPPLTPLTLTGYKSSTRASAQILGRLLAEEVRLLVPPRLQIVKDWRLLFSLEQDGASLSTLYGRCNDEGTLGGTGPGGSRAGRGGCVLVVKDTGGGVFGAYLSHPPKPSNGHYYGHGESFLWRASTLPSIPTLSSLPPLPSSDTEHATRSTTVTSALPKNTSNGASMLTLLSADSAATNGGGSRGTSGTSTPERIRFKAFPYSGENDYLMFCEAGFLSVGGG